MMKKIWKKKNMSVPFCSAAEPAMEASTHFLNRLQVLVTVPVVHSAGCAGLSKSRISKTMKQSVL